MAVQTAICGCGSPVEIDLMTRVGICPACGNQVQLTRDEVVGSDTVRNDMDIAVKYFKEKDVSSAVRYAEDLLAYVPDSAIGLFITSFYRCFMAENKHKTALKEFFTGNRATFLEVNEFKQLLILIRLALPYLDDLEGEVMVYVSSSGNQFLAETFFESYLPTVIGRHSGSDWLNPTLKSYYMNLVSVCNVPKTLFALYKSLTDNEDSPERKENYGMISMMKGFIDGFATSIGDIFSSIANPAVKEKFMKAYNAKMRDINAIYKSEAERMRRFKEGR